MLIYPSFIYLQNQKTGCTFVVRCLREFRAEPLQAHHRHAALESPPGKFCFINVREPLALYRSLFAYGLDGKGMVFLRLKRMGHGHLYEQGEQGFLSWLDFVIHPQHASLLSEAYTPVVARQVGFMSWRFLRLACPGFEKTTPSFPDAQAVAVYAETHNAMGAVLHQENLRDELKALLTGKLAAYFPDQDALCRWLAETPKINASKNTVDDVAVEGVLLARVLRKEAFLYRNFYPDVLLALLPLAERAHATNTSRRDALGSNNSSNE